MYRTSILLRVVASDEVEDHVTLARLPSFVLGPTPIRGSPSSWARPS